MARQVKLQSSTHETPHAQGGARRVLFLGFGYVAQALASTLSHHHALFATVRTQEGADLAQRHKATPIFLSDKNEFKKNLASVDTILISTPPLRDANQYHDPLVEMFGPDWAKLAPRVTWAGYLSATSVYGDRDGHYVFEEELLSPTTERGRTRVLAELNWLESGLPVHIFRLAGIYGPERNALIRLKKPDAKIIVKPDHISSRIHVGDIVTALMASMAHPNPHRIYNLADDLPAAPHEVSRYAAKLLNKTVSEIAFPDPSMSAMAKSFYQERRKTHNGRAKYELNWTPQYPDYRVGLDALAKTVND